MSPGSTSIGTREELVGWLSELTSGGIPQVTDGGTAEECLEEFSRAIARQIFDKLQEFMKILKKIFQQDFQEKFHEEFLEGSSSKKNAMEIRRNP